jgi:hypothetical protein
MRHHIVSIQISNPGFYNIYYHYSFEATQCEALLDQDIESVRLFIKHSSNYDSWQQFNQDMLFQLTLDL